MPFEKQSNKTGDFFLISFHFLNYEMVNESNSKTPNQRASYQRVNDAQSKERGKMNRNQIHTMA